MPLLTRLILAATLLVGTAVAQAQQPALLGNWQCQTPQGAATLAFGDNGQLVYNGDTTQYAVQGNVITALVDGFPQQYRYQINGDALAIANPDGTRTNCQRGGGAAGAFAQGGVLSGAANGALQGTMCGWSGNANYSRTTRVIFDGRGRFGTGSESSFSNRHGSGYGSGGVDGGFYMVTSVQVGAPIRVGWANGEDDQATQAMHNAPVQPGRYRYDPTSGLYGYWGREAVCYIRTGHGYGNVPPNASNGNTGIFLNGRHINATEIVQWQALFRLAIQPGRYWLDGNTGNVGVEGNPQPTGNVLAAIKASRGNR